MGPVISGTCKQVELMTGLFPYITPPGAMQRWSFYIQVELIYRWSLEQVRLYIKPSLQGTVWPGMTHFQGTLSCGVLCHLTCKFPSDLGTHFMWGHYFGGNDASPDQRFQCTWPEYEECNKISVNICLNVNKSFGWFCAMVMLQGLKPPYPQC